MARGPFAQIYLVHQLYQFLDQETLIMVLHAIDTSPLDYCNEFTIDEVAIKDQWKL